MIPLLMLWFVMVDGLVMRNPQPWAAPIRAGMVVVMFVIGLGLVWRSGYRISVGAAVIVGVLAAMVISDLYRSPAGIGLSTWLIYAGVYAVQRIIKFDWSVDFWSTGLLVSVAVFVVAINGHAPPDGAWNRNTIGGLLAVLAPSAMAIKGRWRWAVFAVIASGVIVTTSRGAIVGLAASMAVMIQPWALLAVPFGGALLAVAMPNRLGHALKRFDYLQQAIDAWRTSPWLGLGPGLRLPEGGIHAHNTLVGIGVQVGVIGMAVVGAMAIITQRLRLQRWQVAALAAVAVHSMVDDPLCWWPVGIVVSLIMASCDSTSHSGALPEPVEGSIVA